MKCPKCGSKRNFRHRRRAWMKLLPWTRLYRCDTCATDYLATCRRITYRRSVMRLGVLILSFGMLWIGILGPDRLADVIGRTQEFLARLWPGS